MQNGTYRGTVRRVFFANPESPFMAGVLALDDEGAKALSQSEMRFSGKVAAAVGDKLEVVGRWTKHPKFGDQFEVESGLVKMDESPTALAHLLATDDRFEGLGPVRAKRVVEAALALSNDGDLAVALKEYTEEIATRAKVSIEIVRNACEVWNERRTYFDALAQLVGMGWSNAQAQSIVAKLGDNAPAVVRGEPYSLIGMIPRFGFRTVDQVARRMGIDLVDPMRLSSGIAYCLDQMSGSGSTWTTRSGLLAAALQELRPDSLQAESLTSQALDSMIALGLVYSDVAPNGSEVVADARMAAAEFEVFERLVSGLKHDGEHDEWLSSARGIDLEMPRAKKVMATLNAGQRRAVLGTWRWGINLITGGAGVGKTYTMRSICEIAEEAGLTVALAAPTGKAARKLAQATGRDAMTIHRLLEPRFDEETGGFRFARGKNSQLDFDLVVVDEVSMVDVKLMRSLLHAVSPMTRLLLVGDHHQIPSVGAGAILRDLLSGGAAYHEAVHVLTEIVRQAGDLARNTTALLDGVVHPHTSPVWGVQHVDKGDGHGAAALVSAIVEHVVTAPTPLEPFGRPLDLAWDVQVLAPMKKGELGTYALNAHLQRLRQRLLGNPAPEPIGPDERPRPLIGDRIIWTKNDYTLGIFNGTQGVVVNLRRGKGMDLILEDGREVEIESSKMVNVEVAYAMTIHKSQGSEWPYVIMVASSSHWVMHDRNLLYTGASRASQSLTVIGDAAGIRHFAAERKSALRQTFGSLMVAGWRPKVAPRVVDDAQLVGDEAA
jgi:exodeoxyribonuclease V alpha subunit